ncbi:restriction endonuclease subunit S [Brevibacterium aurantiacum]|uniref:Type I restriction modification DNA specificity domain-containing protein n=1 Tax=Brevibacterium aurantiacum TaxID=273384 RepID=A0A2H1HHX2_BREAU|nr:restriction endonuclease subunit S [Brevibacterium aurantiacum]SMX62485.1 Type I restriction modification DNA specificity domain-containing protein [Brevibacterium aurantiacum]
MSRIDELIQELCPDGVTFVTIGEAATVTAGATPSKSVASYWTNGTIPWLSSGEVNKGTIHEADTFITKEGYDSCSTRMVPARAVVIALAGQGKTRGMVARTRLECCTNQSLASIVPDSDELDSDFLFYYLKTQYSRLRDVSSGDGTRGGLNLAMIRAYRIPVPPLEVQCEIVRVLDKFTQLEAELEARRTQYEHYRTEFLTFGDDVPRRPLREVATIGTGSHDTKDATPDGEFIFYARGREPLRLDSYDFDEQAIITAGDGVGVGKVFHFADGKYALHQRAYRVVPGKQIDSRFIYHYLVSDFSRYLERTSVHASVTSLRRPMFLKYPVPVPPRAEQERIVATLDKLDALVNDISIGLPGELVARRKQYEHYRDRLLTFKELPA